MNFAPRTTVDLSPKYKADFVLTMKRAIQKLSDFLGFDTAERKISTAPAKTLG